MNSLALPTCDAGAGKAASIKHLCMHREKLLLATASRVWMQLVAHVLLHHLSLHMRP